MILVTGASDKTGGALVGELLADGISVRAAVRRDDARSAQLKHLGAEVVVADIFDADSLTEAMRERGAHTISRRFTPTRFRARVTQTVEALTRRPAKSFETTARRYAAMPFARPTMANRTRHRKLPCDAAHAGL